MKKIKILILLLLVVLLPACSNYEDLATIEEFKGVIENINDNSFLVRTNEAFGDLANISIINIDNKKEFKVGDEISVFFDGQVKESYPVQITAMTIKKMGDNETVISKELADSISNFAYKTSVELLSENVNYSPLSTYLTLNLIEKGAAGNTEKELIELLGITPKISEDILELLKHLKYNKENSKFFLANSIWVEKEVDGNEVKFEEDFLSDIENEFNTELFLVDFGRKKTGKEMSKWVYDNTNGLLNPKIITSKGQIASIVNTVYFKDKWETPFIPSYTKKGEFTTSKDEKIEVDFMEQTLTSNYEVNKNWQKATLPFENGGEMFFVMPTEGNLDDIINEENLKLIVESENEITKEVNWKLPRFSLDSEFEMTDTLKKLGVNDIFNNKANFEKMTKENVYIDNIKQNSKIIVEEGGVESAAFTQAIFETTSISLDIIDFTLNKPFLYGITNVDGTLLFIGRYDGK